MFPIAHKVDSQISDIEDDIFDSDTRRIVQNISWVRRDIIALRRIIRPQVSIIANLEERNRPFISEDLDEYFGDIYDHITQVRDILDEHYEIIADLSEATDSLISFRINEVMRTSTVISVVLLPLTLISSVYGMNVPLPLDANPYAFLIISGLMVAVLVSMLLYFRHRRWL
jgi:magnesium transporter